MERTGSITRFPRHRARDDLIPRNNASILASLTGCYRPAINTFIEARKQRIDELNAAHGLGPGHNRATARTHPNAIPDLVKGSKKKS